jgi:hypothetical protein
VRILSKRTNFEITNEINAIRFPCCGDPGIIGDPCVTTQAAAGGARARGKKSASHRFRAGAAQCATLIAPY